MYDLELDRVVKEIRDSEAERVLVQLPDGMRSIAFKIAKTLKGEANAEVIISGDSCYGACDLAINQAKETGADVLIHYGHSEMVSNTEIPVIYVEAHIDLDVKKIVEKVYPHLKNWRNIGLTTTVQHVHQLKILAKTLGSKELIAVIGGSTELAPHPGQILGCHYGTAKNIADKVDGFLYIGGGRFHPLGLAQATGKPVIMFNPFSGSTQKIREKELMNFAKKRMASITAAKHAKFFGIIISSKIGQRHIIEARCLRDSLREIGKSSYLIYLDDVKVENLQNFTEIQAFIITACPRIALDGLPRLSKPLLTINEARVVLGELEWETFWPTGYLA